VLAMKEGAFEFLQKPVDSHHLLLLVGRVLEEARLRAENILLRDEYAKRYGFPRIIGDSTAMQRVGREIQQVAQTPTTVLLLGESGTGKELFARAIHHLSPRRNAPFVAINCAAIPDTLIENELFGHEKGAYTGADQRRAGKFELASRGTIFLDEISEIAPGVQSKLLRVLEERKITRLGGSADIEVDVRVIAATNRDLKAAVAAKQFREDLYFRLAVFPVHIPALRERRSDVRQIAEFFAAKYGRELRRAPLRLTDQAIRALEEYDWPGNVRELENCIERACILSRGLEITPVDLNIAPPADYSPREELALLDGFDLRDDRTRQAHVQIDDSVPVADEIALANVDAAGESDRAVDDEDFPMVPQIHAELRRPNARRQEVRDPDALPAQQGAGTRQGVELADAVE